MIDTDRFTGVISCIALSRTLSKSPPPGEVPVRKLCWFALPFCGAVYAACLGLPLPWLWGAVLAIAGIAGAFLKRLPLCLACLGLALGLLWFHGYSQLVRAPAVDYAGRTTAFSATVTGFSRETSIGSVSVEARLHIPNAPDPKILLYTNSSDLTLFPGDHISGTARFQSAGIIQGEESSYYEAKGIYLRGSTVDSLSVQHPRQISVRSWGAYIARALQESAAAIFPDDVSGLISALLTGDKTGLSGSTYTWLQRSGAAHIVAVSGLHLSFFAGMLALIFRRRSKIGVLLTALLILLFSAVAGFTPSVLRAAFMVMMTLLAPLCGREEDKPTTLALALFVLLLINPYSAQSVSLQLSFGAVAGIHAVSSPAYRAMTRFLRSGGSLPRRAARRAWRAFAANLSVTLGALLFTTPLTAWYFGTVSIISPVTNLLILWAVSLIFSLGLVLTLLGLSFPVPAAVLAFPAALLARGVLAVTRALGSLSFASLSMDSLYLAAWLALVYAILLAALLRRCKRPIIPVCAAVISLCTSILLTCFSLTTAPLTVTMLDVGQGQCILLTSGGYTALIDCGGNKDNAGDIAADYLQSAGISHLDLLVLTHCHSDHANGAPELFSRVDISALVLPDQPSDASPYRDEILSLAREQGTEITLLSDNRTIALGESILNLYAPLGDGGNNEAGLFALASCNDFDLLITGDANTFIESLLVKYNNLPDIEVLAAGHHGSKHSTSELLLDVLKPETCLISVGYNTYGHPAQDTLTRLAQREIEVYRTDLSGHLTIRYKGE